MTSREGLVDVDVSMLDVLLVLPDDTNMVSVCDLMMLHPCLGVAADASGDAESRECGESGDVA